ncbi:precorrin-8X methylmutase [Salmonella enterica subsp. enterica]|nr:precorrin-8X methylmutase [Salmonella enterica subsp. enterica]
MATLFAKRVLITARQFLAHEAIIKLGYLYHRRFRLADICGSADALEQLCDALHVNLRHYLCTDTTMALSGINKRLLATFMASVAVISAIRARGARRKNAGDSLNGRRRYRYRRERRKQAFVFGNAPTAPPRLLL